jgi:fused-like protein
MTQLTGVILYELYVGSPPFYTNNIYSLINLIVKDPIKYPDNISPDFKSFLMALLHKVGNPSILLDLVQDPSQRVNWPELADHPFVRESEEERELRLSKPPPSLANFRIPPELLPKQEGSNAAPQPVKK